MSRIWAPSATDSGQPETKLRVYTGAAWTLSPQQLDYFESKYEIPASAAFPNIQLAADGRYLLPIYDPKGRKRGVVARTPWDGAPHAQGIKFAGPKAITYRHRWGPVQSHYGNTHSGPLVVVEDQLSAIKLAARGYNSVALLGTPAAVVGTYGGSDRVAELATRARTHDEVVIALDSDATDAAFMFVRKWGSAFRRIRVAILSRDIKDTPAAELAEVLGI